MIQRENLSVECRNIVDKYTNDTKSKNRPVEKYQQLIVSLYATTERADSKLLEILKAYNVDLTNVLTDSEITMLKNERDNVIRYCYEAEENCLIPIYDEERGTTLLPQSLIDFCLGIAKVRSNSEIFLPYSGDSQITLSLPDCTYEGFEIGKMTWAFSQILLQACKTKANIKIIEKVSKKAILEAIPQNKQYDFIFAYPPQINNRYISKQLSQLAMESLKDNGVMCCVLPAFSFCSDSEDWKGLKKILFDNSFNATAIIMMDRLLPATYGKICVLMLEKNGKGQITLADVTDSDFYSRRNAATIGNQYVAKTQSLIDTILQRNKKHVWCGTMADMELGLELNPKYYINKQYLPQPKEGEKLIRMADLVDVVMPKDVEFAERPSVATKELSSNYWNCIVEQAELPQRSCSHILETDCVLAGFVGGKFKVGKINGLSSTNSIGVRQRIIPFRLKSNLVSEDFLFRCLLSEDVSRQVEKLSITELGLQDFLNLHIIVPSLDEQNRLCKEDARQSFSEADKKIKSSADEFRRDIHMKKHAIGQTIFNLSNWWKVLQRARKEGNGIVDDDAVVGNTQKIAVKDIYNNLQQAISQLQEQINRFDRGNGLVAETFALTDFIEDYIKKHNSPLFKYDYDASSHRQPYTMYGFDQDENGKLFNTDDVVAEAGEPFEWVTFPLEALTIVFDNIISNACSHGFEGREPSQNIVKIELDMDGENYIITISNNGKPVQDDVTEEDVFTYNKSTQIGKNHYGIGGYEVKRLMQEFDGDAEFVSQPNNAYPVAYRLTFYNTNLDSL